MTYFLWYFDTLNLARYLKLLKKFQIRLTIELYRWKMHMILPHISRITLFRSLIPEIIYI